jgi:chromosome segregation ATPase
MGKSISKDKPLSMREQVGESLETMTALIAKTSAEKFYLEEEVTSWNRRVSRANRNLRAAPDELKEPIRTLLVQAKEQLSKLSEKLDKTSELLSNLTSHRDQMEKSLAALNAGTVKKQLHERLGAIVAEGDGENLNPNPDFEDVRELEKTIHTVKALIELRQGSN